MASGCVMVFVGAILLVATTLASECVLVFVGFVGTNPFALLVLAAFGAPVPITTVVFVNIVRIGGWFVKPFWFWWTLLATCVFARKLFVVGSGMLFQCISDYIESLICEIGLFGQLGM